MKSFTALFLTVFTLSTTALAAPSPSYLESGGLQKRSACYPAFISLLKAQADDLCKGSNSVVIEQDNVKFDALTAPITYDGKYNDPAGPGKNSQPVTLAKGQVTKIYICQSCTPPPVSTGTPHKS